MDLLWSLSTLPRRQRKTQQKTGGISGNIVCSVFCAALDASQSCTLGPFKKQGSGDEQDEVNNRGTGGEDKKTRGEEEARHETKAKKHRMLCLGPAHRRLVAATQVSNTNSLLTLNSNALPTESFVTPFADWSGFF